MKKYLFIALAALGFAACEEKIGDQPHSGEVEQSYIAINLMSADLDTRAATDAYGYEDGTTAERAIKTAYFFFFDEDGNPFNVAANSGATNPDYSNNGKNHLSLELTANPENNDDVNISDITNAVLILNTYKGIYPSKVVAVLNWTPENKYYSLSDLHNIVNNSIGNETSGYVMSNSVYMNDNNIIDAVTITNDNIKTTAADAENEPINIYVERTAAKVVVSASGKVANTENIFSTDKKSSLIPLDSGSGSEIDVYVKLHGWELYNDYQTSSLLKNIENWDTATLGLTWNDSPFYRSYWANSQSTDLNDSFNWSYTKDTDADTYSGFPTTNGFIVADGVNTAGTFAYCGENTNQVTKSGDVITSDPRTKVILKGQLMQKNGENYEPLELARWYGNEYAGNAALRTAVVNSLRYTIYSSTDASNFSPIKPEDLECVAGNSVGAEAYEVGFQLSTTGKAKTWYQYSSADGYVVFGDNGVDGDNAAKANAYLKGVEPALLYSNGMTYYIVDIKHLGTAGKTAEYGVVRNHVYQIDINSISGYGSPVYSNMSNIITPPEYPIEDEASYVAARINVLSWKVVKQEVNIVK